MCEAQIMKRFAVCVVISFLVTASNGFAEAAPAARITAVQVGASRNPTISIAFLFSSDVAYQAQPSGMYRLRFLHVDKSRTPSLIATSKHQFTITASGTDVLVGGLSGYTFQVVRGQNMLTVRAKPSLQGENLLRINQRLARRFASASHPVLGSSFFAGEAMRIVAAERVRYAFRSFTVNRPPKLLGQALKVLATRYGPRPAVLVSLATYGVLPNESVVATRDRTLAFDRVSGALLSETDVLADDAVARAAGLPLNAFAKSK